jgi:hypothetical protein
VLGCRCAELLCHLYGLWLLSTWQQTVALVRSTVHAQACKQASLTPTAVGIKLTYDDVCLSIPVSLCMLSAHLQGRRRRSCRSCACCSWRQQQQQEAHA